MNVWFQSGSTGFATTAMLVKPKIQTAPRPILPLLGQALKANIMGTLDSGTIALVIGTGYLLGAIPFGLILTRMFGAGDLRAIGSGNIGATNVLRTGRKGLAAGTLLLDMGKGAAAVCVARMIAPELALVGGFAALLGHCYPVWLKFKGGKGVATMLGIALAFNWGIGLIFAGVWLGSLALTRMSSAGGMAAAVATPIATLAIFDWHPAKMLALMAIIVLWKHRENIARIRAGTEPKVGAKA
jgi:glycerol-3-phosphate acyltransferase PlsY